MKIYEIIRDHEGKLQDIVPIDASTIRPASPQPNSMNIAWVQVIDAQVVQTFKDNEILIGGEFK